MTLCQGTY